MHYFKHEARMLDRYDNLMLPCLTLRTHPPLYTRDEKTVYEN